MDRGLQKNRICAVAIVGTILGILVSFSPGSFFILLLTIGAIFLIYRFSTNERERNFILTIFLVALGVRIIFTLLMLSFAIFSGRLLNYAQAGSPNVSTPYFIADSGYATLRALFTNMYWQGEPLSNYTVGSIVKHDYGFSTFIFVLAVFFGFFGYSPISSRFINCFLGSLTAILVYSIVKNIFNERPARLAAILTAFFPSMFLWSITNLKDAGVTFMVCLMLWSLVKFQRSKNFYYLAITALAIWLQAFLRQSYRGEFVLITIAIILFYIFYLFLSNLPRRKRIAVFLMIFIIGSSFILLAKSKIKSTFEQGLKKVYFYHSGVVGTGGITYKLLPDEFYRNQQRIGFSDFFKMLGKGWFHVMLEPLPMRLRTKAILSTFPQMLLWYFLIPFAMLGVVVSVRYKLRESSFLIIYFLVSTSTLAVTGGNVGTIFRVRDVNTPIILLFSAIGLFNTFNTLKQ